MNPVEYRQLVQLIKGIEADFRAEIKELQKTITAQLKGYGVIGCEEEMWSEETVCIKYGVSKRKMFNHRKNGDIAYTKTGKGRTCRIMYRPADVRELFADTRYYESY